MFVSRVGLLVGLTIGAAIGPAISSSATTSHATTVESSQRGLNRPLSRSNARPRRLHAPLVSRAVLAAWGRVANCEEGGFDKAHDAYGPTYYGNIGWLWATWQMFRRADFPVSMANASPAQQAWAGQRFVAYYHMAIPDQHGCTGGY